MDLTPEHAYTTAVKRSEAIIAEATIEETLLSMVALVTILKLILIRFPITVKLTQN